MKENFFKKINANIKLIFKDRYDELYPTFYSSNQFKESADILFIGINPAGDEKGYDKIGKNGLDDRKIATIIEENEEFFQYRKYYGIYENLFGVWKDKKSSWNILDLFVIRGTSQKKTMEKKGEDEAFFRMQYKEIFIPLVNYLNPKILVVTNAEASSILKEYWYNNANEKVLDKGYWISPREIGERKVIFTSMLSGQRAMDINTRELLRWHITTLI